MLKLPVPVPPLILLSEVVGVWLVPQQTPLAVTVAPPSEVTSPPPIAKIEVILETVANVTVGGVLIASFLQLYKKREMTLAIRKAGREDLIFITLDLVIVKHLPAKIKNYCEIVIVSLEAKLFQGIKASGEAITKTPINRLSLKATCFISKVPFRADFY